MLKTLLKTHTELAVFLINTKTRLHEETEETILCSFVCYLAEVYPTISSLLIMVIGNP